jgi:hypothetical protein
MSAILAALALCLAAAAPSVAAVQPGLYVKDGTLTKGGKPFRGIGVNYFSAFYRTLTTSGDTGYEAGFRALADAKIPFCRIMGCGFWPTEQALYRKDRAEFFRRFDAVVASARKNGIGLIPSLFWNVSCVPDIVGDPVSAWGDPASKTHAYMRDYVSDVVRRYSKSPAIWGWEFGNEFNLGANLPNAAQWRPSVAPQLGTPASRTAKDEWTYEVIRTAFAAFAGEVRKHDPGRIVVTGDAFPRECAWHHWKQNNWERDTPEQWAEMLRDDSPDPIDVLTVHAYSEPPDRIRESQELSRRWGKPLFVGEFGAPGPRDKSEKQFTGLLQAIESARVPLSALWVYNYDAQDREWNVTPDNERGYQFAAIVEANARIRAELARESR